MAQAQKKTTVAGKSSTRAKAKSSAKSKLDKPKRKAASKKVV